MAELLLLALGAGWSLVYFLGKRTLKSIDKKVDDSFKRIEKANKEMKESYEKHEAKVEKSVKNISVSLARKLERHSRAYIRLFVSRQEFGAFTASINHKIDSIYQILNEEGIKKK